MSSCSRWALYAFADAASLASRGTLRRKYSTQLVHLTATNWRNYSTNFPVYKCTTVDGGLRLVPERIDDLQPRRIADTWSLVSKLSKEPMRQEQQLWVLLRHTMKLLRKFDHAEFTTVILSMAKIAKSNHWAKKKKNTNQQPGRSNMIDVLRRVGDHIVSLDSLEMFTLVELADIVWAYATAHARHPDLFIKVAHHIVDLNDLKAFDSKAMANIVWAYAKANKQHSGLMNNIEGSVAGSKLVKSRGFSKNASVYTQLNQSSLEQLQTMSVPTSSHTVKNHLLFERIGCHIAELNDLSSFSTQALSEILWAYATSDIPHPTLFKKIGEYIVDLKDLSQFNARVITDIVWAYAKSNTRHTTLLTKVEEHLLSSHSLRSFKARELAMLAWAYAVANIDAPLLFNDDFIQLLINNQTRFTTEHLAQLHQWHIWQSKENSNNGLPENLVKPCYDAFTATEIKVSETQKDVATELDLMGLDPIEEYIATSGYSLDALIEMNGKLVAIEVDGPSHFIGRRPTARTLLKRRQVASADKIFLVSVPYWKWIKFGNNRNEKQEYLRSLLSSIDVK